MSLELFTAAQPNRIFADILMKKLERKSNVTFMGSGRSPNIHKIFDHNRKTVIFY